LDVSIPPGAEERAHGVVMGAYASHRPVLRRKTYWRPALAVAIVAVAAGVLASPPGRSVIHAIREAIGVKNAKRELFSLPAPGRLLVNSATGPWVLEQNGSKRLLGPYREASWSPFGRFVVARRGDQLVTMEPDGNVHWTLARPDLRLPAWGGKHDDTRIAYLTRGNLHVVAGDGSGDAARCAGSVPAVAPAWQPGSLKVLAFAANRQVVVDDVTNCRQLFRRSPMPKKLEWAPDGMRLLALSAAGAVEYDLRGRVVARVPHVKDGTFAGHELATLGENGDVRIGRRVLFRAVGLRQILSSPDGRWLLLTWPAANQWVFVRAAAPHTIRAFSGIGRQFGGGTFPTLSGWAGK
jgi:hypothetical protein